MAVISGDGIFSHVFIGANDVATSAKFYDATLAPLGVKNLGPFGNNWVLYGKDKPAFVIAKPGNGAHGGSDEGAPGARSHLPGAYAAYLRDPAGNKICTYTFTE